jgi:hypothetical protein
MKPPSKRFNPSRWAQFLVPAILLLLLFLLIATLVMILLAVLPI